MEWVETTGRTVDEAVEAALDELGVDRDEVEYEVLEEARSGFLGRREARIRARVKPLSREKPTDRRRRSSRAKPVRSAGRGRGREENGAVAVAEGDEAPRSARPAGRSRGGRGRRRSSNGEHTKREGEGVSEHDEVPVEEQAAAAEEFTRGLVEAFGADGEVVITVDEEDGVLVEVTGRDLGLLVGPKGATLQAIEELVRTVVQRKTEGHGTRINVDVAGYRAKRRAALQGFVLELADQVRESGKDLALEPMSASDRKVVHDAIAELDGVTTASEGEEPRRRVVLRPA